MKELLYDSYAGIYLNIISTFQKIVHFYLGPREPLKFSPNNQNFLKKINLVCFIFSLLMVLALDYF